MAPGIVPIRYNALLQMAPLSKFRVAKRLSWASMRYTTRVEDRAYSLLGLFDITMPTLYGACDAAYLGLEPRRVVLFVDAFPQARRRRDTTGPRIWATLLLQALLGLRPFVPAHLLHVGVPRRMDRGRGLLSR